MTVAANAVDKSYGAAPSADGKPSSKAARPDQHIAASARPGSKQALVIEMLSANDGATIDVLIAATGWLPHTTRAALTGLRKRGFSIELVRAKGLASIYRIARAPAQTSASEPISA